MSSSEDSKIEYVQFGIHKISDDTQFFLPKTEIRFQKISDEVYSYSRKDSEDNLVEKNIPAPSGTLEIEICPIRPLNHPARRTTYMYLQLNTPVFLPEGSSATIYLQCPIEIGLFLVHDSHKDSLDWVTCNHQDSRFALYGSPDSGVLCKYNSSPIVSSYEDSIPYVNGVIKMDLKNELIGGHSIKRVVFPIIDNSIYYKDKYAIFDGITATLKKKLAIQIIDVEKQKIQTDWIPSPSYEETVNVKYAEMGVD